MSNRKGLLFEMKQHIKNKYKNNMTQKAYKKQAERFCNHIKEARAFLEMENRRKYR